MLCGECVLHLQVRAGGDARNSNTKHIRTKEARATVKHDGVEVSSNALMDGHRESQDDGQAKYAVIGGLTSQYGADGRMDEGIMSHVPIRVDLNVGEGNLPVRWAHSTLECRSSRRPPSNQRDTVGIGRTWKYSMAMHHCAQSPVRKVWWMIEGVHDLGTGLELQERIFGCGLQRKNTLSLVISFARGDEDVRVFHGLARKLLELMFVSLVHLQGGQEGQEPA